MAKIALSAEFPGFSYKFRPLKNIFRTLENDHSIRHQSIPPLSAGRVFEPVGSVGALQRSLLLFLSISILLFLDVPPHPSLLYGSNHVSAELLHQDLQHPPTPTCPFGSSVLHLWRSDFNPWRVPNPPGANPLVAERAPWRSSQSCVAGGQLPIGNPYRFLSFILHAWQPLCDPNSHSWGRLFQLPGG